MGECVVRIERLANGYEVELKDPKIVEQNNKPSKGGSLGAYKDPHVAYAFKTVEEVIAFLQKNLDKAMPMDDYATSFEEAAQETDDDE